MEITLIPNFVFKKLNLRFENKMHLNNLLSSLLIITMFLIFNNHQSTVDSVFHFCLFQKLLHIPCLGCGVTSSFFSISQAKLVTAWEYNPAGIFLYLFLVMQIPLRLTALNIQKYSHSVINLSNLGSKLVIFSLLVVWMQRIL